MRKTAFPVFGFRKSLVSWASSRSWRASPRVVGFFLAMDSAFQISRKYVSQSLKFFTVVNLLYHVETGGSVVANLDKSGLKTICL